MPAILSPGCVYVTVRIYGLGRRQEWTAVVTGKSTGKIKRELNRRSRKLTRSLTEVLEDGRILYAGREVGSWRWTDAET